jgi:hypothetical protein
MDIERLQRMALEELEQASSRFWARAGDLPDVHEHFAAACARWLYEWTVSYLLPDDALVDPEAELRILDPLKRAKRDLELRSEGDGE